MHNNTPDTALLLFTRTPGEEVCHKKLVPAGAYAQGYQIALALVNNSQVILAQTGLPFYVFSSAQQKGRSFGERLYNAFADLFALGYQQVITIGNDCPELSAAEILKVNRQLPEKNVILGPDKAGGIFLLGLTRRVFNQCTSFENIRWQTSSVLKDCLAFFDTKTESEAYVWPVSYADVNSPADLTALWRQKKIKVQIIRYLKRLWFSLNNWCRVKEVLCFYPVYRQVLSFRGPPQLISTF